jgi:hypothetical protein
MKLKELGWNEVWWKEIAAVLRRKTPTVVAGLCRAQADGSDPKYPAGESHEILVMVREEEPEAESGLADWLQSNGWLEAVILESRKLEQSFLTDDSLVRACYVNAMTLGGGCVVYSDPPER